MNRLMKKKIMLLAAMGMTVMTIMTGCGAGDTASEKINGSAGETAKVSETAIDTESDSAVEETASAESTEISTENRDGFGEENPYTWQEYTVTLPKEWVGRCIMEENEAGFSIYQKASYEKDGTSGYICGFFRTREPVEYGYGKTIIAYTDDGVLYYLVQPTDVPCDTEDEKITGEYVRMCQQVPQLKASLQIAAFGLHSHADEYMIPTSSIFKLDPAALAGLSDNVLWIARNEIYARHGRQFDNWYLQQYFNRCTWYEGEISPGEFQENVLNQIEKDNLQLLLAAEKEYDRKHPYPKMYQASETAREDLNGDGKTDEISYRIMDQENGETLCMITVNGETYTANELAGSQSEGIMTNPTADCFFISDILENDGLLEIAVIDEGPSEDLVTYFFQYDGTLSCIGLVFGIPFSDRNGGLNGFNGVGNIAGEARVDLIETAYLQDNWWYDGSRILDLDIRWHDFLPSDSHILYEDLPVYCEWDETSATAVIPAQEEVFFLGTDMERWILVKGKDGSQGYMIVEDGKIAELNKPADDVFSGLYFFD